MDGDEIKRRIRQDIILLTQTFKQVISQQPINREQFLQEPIYMEALDTLQPVFDAYDEGYSFGEQGFYYGVKRNSVCDNIKIYCGIIVDVGLTVALG
ncbi:hypothetical protein RMATCC62417_02012 [Rhizopus microsporus]|nr:hypothetical protein RMATCC62417_02012 [Rhizopus microsporus]